MNYLLFLWNKIRTTGSKHNTSLIDLKNIVFTNTLLVIATVSYIIFSVSIFFLQIFSTKDFLLSSTTLLFGFLIVFVLMKYSKILLAKNILLLLIFFGTYFYDSHVGKWAGIYLYYFTFFFVTINIISWKKEKFWLILHLSLPIILIIIPELHIVNTKEITNKNDAVSIGVFIFNFCMAFFMIMLNAFFIIRENISYQESLTAATLNVQSLINNTNGYIWSIDMGYKLIAFNTSYEAIIKKNYGVESFKGYDLKLLLQLPNNPKEIVKIYERVLQGESFTAEYFSNNDYFEVQASPLYDTNHIQNGATFHSRIITEKKNSRSKFTASKNKLGNPCR